MFENGFPREWSTIKKLALLFRAVVNAIAPVLKTVTGEIIHITDALARPAQSLKVNFSPVQSGSGDPSPDNVRPISGWTEANIYDDPKYAGLIEWNQQFEELTSTDWEVSNVNYGTVAFSNGECTYTVVTAGTTYVYGFRHKTTKKFGVSGHKYFLSVDCKASKSGITIGGDVCNKGFTFNGTVGTSYQNFSTILSSTGNQIAYICTRGGTAVGDTLTFKNIMLIDLTQVFGEGNEPSTVEAFKALFPKDYYAYNEGTETLVSAVNGDTYREYTIDLDGTRYGGTLDVTSGKLTVDRAMVTLNGSESWSNRGNDMNQFYCDNASSDAFVTTSAEQATLIGAVSDQYKGVTWQGFQTETNCVVLWYRQPWIGIQDSRYADVAALKSGLSVNPVQVCYKLATPIEVDLTPTEITLFAGENNLWSDANGNLELTYLADGNVSEIEALNILLGGQYSNNHGEDEPTDREALNILLGGNER